MRFEFIPLVRRRSSHLVLLETPLLQLLTFFSAFCSKDTLISLNAKLLAVLTCLIFDEGLELFPGLHLSLNLKLLNILLEVLLATSLLQCHRVLPHAQLLQMLFDVVDCLFIVSQLFLLVTIVVTEVACVEYIVLQGVVVVRQ